MNRFAQLRYGEVVYIYETELTKAELTRIFAPDCVWFDVTGTDVAVGHRILYNAAKGRFEYLPPTEPATFAQLKRAKLDEIALWTRRAITGGFISAAKGKRYRYDSEEGDQATFAALYNASRSADFPVTEPYNGQIPIRAIPVGKAEKVVLLHDAEELQKLTDDLALHIGACKERGWELQMEVAAAGTPEDLQAIRWSGGGGNAQE